MYPFMHLATQDGIMWPMQHMTIESIPRSKFHYQLLSVWLLLFVMLSACGSSNSAERVDPTPDLTEAEKVGFQVYTRNCAACHLLTEGDVKVGPPFYNIATIAGQRVAGQDAKTYLYTSILKPDAYLVEGFENVMPKGLAKSLTGEELDAVVAYLLTQKE